MSSEIKSYYETGNRTTQRDTETSRNNGVQYAQQFSGPSGIISNGKYIASSPNVSGPNDRNSHGSIYGQTSERSSAISKNSYVGQQHGDYGSKSYLGPSASKRVSGIDENYYHKEISASAYGQNFSKNQNSSQYNESYQRGPVSNTHSIAKVTNSSSRLGVHDYTATGRTGYRY